MTTLITLNIKSFIRS